jgi:hypothetical protein
LRAKTVSELAAGSDGMRRFLSSSSLGFIVVPPSLYHE